MAQLRRSIFESIRRLNYYREHSGPLVLVHNEAEIISSRCKRYFQILEGS